MFKNLTIEMSGPICNCEEENISWGVHRMDSGHNALVLVCRTCKTKLSVPYDKLVACVKFDKGYPGKKMPEQGPYRNSGNVVAFKKRDDGG